MDLGVVGGLIIALGAILGANMLEGGTVGSLFNVSATLIILGGTVGATAVSVGLEEMRRLPLYFRWAILKQEAGEGELVETLVRLAQKARREGLLALEEDAQKLEDPFMRRGLQLVVDGADPEMVESVLVTEAELEKERVSAGATLFETAGGFAPTMGIIGTVMGLVHVLSNLEDPDELGPAIAVAFLATLWGILTANILWLPMANKLKGVAKQKAHLRQMILEGIISIQKGDNPGVLRDKLSAFLGGEAASPSRGAKAEEKPGEAPVAAEVGG